MRNLITNTYKVSILMILIHFLVYSESKEIIKNEDDYQFLCEVLYTYNYHSIIYTLSEQKYDELEKLKLTKKKSFSFSPSISWNTDGSPIINTSTGLEYNNFRIQTDIENQINGSDTYRGSLQFPLIQSKLKVIKALDEISILEKHKDFLEIENMFLNSSKNLINSFIERSRITNEINTRKETQLLLSSIFDRIKTFKKSGLINGRTIETFSFYLNDNIISIDILRNKRSILENDIMIEFGISKDKVDVLSNSIKNILNDFFKKDKENDIQNFKQNVGNRIDSLNHIILEKRIAIDKSSSYSLLAGPVISKNNKADNITLGINCYFNLRAPYKINKKTFNSPLIKKSDFKSLSSLDSDTVYTKIESYLVDSKKGINSLLKEISLGNVGAVTTLIDYHNKILSHKISLINLKSSLDRSLISRTQSLCEFPFYQKISSIYKND